MLEALTLESSGDPDVDGLEELLLQQRHALLGARDRLARSISDLVQRALVTIRETGRKVSDLIHASADEDEINRRLREAQIRVEKCAEQLSEDVQESIYREMSELRDRVTQIAESVIAKELLSRLERVFIAYDPESTSEAAASDVTKRLGEFLVRHSFNSKSRSFLELFRLDQYSGTATHESTKAIGHFFGKSFKPWEAVKWARLLGNVGRVLSVVGVVLNVVLQIKEDADAHKQEAELRESRTAMRAGFNEVSQVIKAQVDEATKEYISQTFGQRLEEIDRQLEELQDMRQTRSDLAKNLTQVLDDTRLLIREMHSKKRSV